jgi:hypothetical protein
VAKKLAEYVDADGRDWTQLMRPLTLEEAQAAWREVQAYGGVELRDDAAAGLNELATNNFIRIIDRMVYPTSALRILTDRDMPHSFVSRDESALRRFMRPGERRNMAEWRRLNNERQWHEGAQKDEWQWHKEAQKEARSNRIAFVTAAIGVIGCVLAAFAMYQQKASEARRTLIQLKRDQIQLQRELHQDQMQFQRELHQQQMQLHTELHEQVLQLKRNRHEQQCELLKALLPQPRAWSWW